MITKEIAMSQPHELWHSRVSNKDGTPVRARINGKCIVWKTRPADFKLPVKHGLKDCFYITPANAHLWCLPDRWRIEQHYTKGD